MSSVNKLDMKKVFKNNDNDAENEDEDRGIIPTVAADAHLFEAAVSWFECARGLSGGAGPVVCVYDG